MPDEFWTEPTLTPKQTADYRAYMRRVLRKSPEGVACFTDGIKEKAVDRQMKLTDKSVPAEAVPRLKGQNLKVLEMLRAGPATNFELERATGSRRINSRIADVRRYLKLTEYKDIKSRAVDVQSGCYEYRIQ